MAGTLYIVATPIGNLEDITLRALRTLREASVIAAEDTRVTRKLLSRYDIHTPLISYHQHSTERRAAKILDALSDGKNVALVSDAGTPGISDPGYELIAECIAEGIKVESIPGPSAVITALVLSGMPTAEFIFDGFAPRKNRERQDYFRSLRSEARTVCLYESPIRLVKTLEAIACELGDRPIAVVREATKLFEEVFRGTSGEAAAHFRETGVRGEIVLVISGCEVAVLREGPVQNEDIELCLRRLLDSGLSERDAARQCAAELGVPKRSAYSIAIALGVNHENTKRMKARKKSMS